MPDVLVFPKSEKYNISDNAYKHFDSPTVGENIYYSRIAINQPVKERIQEGRKTYINDYSMWTEIVRDKE